MKIKLYNGITTNLNLQVLGGGYDQDSARVVLIIKGEGEGTAGVAQFDVSEAYRIAELLKTNTPPVTRVSTIAGDEGVK